MHLSLWMLVLVPWFAAAQAPGDSSGTAPAWTLVAEDQRSVSWAASSPDAVRDSVLAEFHREGHYFARIDSVRIDSAGGGTVFATAGPGFAVHAIRIEGAEALSEQALLQEMDTRVGGVLDPALLERDLEHLLRRYEQAGHPLAAVEIAGVDLIGDVPGRLRLRLRVSEGPAPVLRGVEVEGDARTDPRYLARVAGLKQGQVLREYRPDDLRAHLEATGFYRSVGEPRLRLMPDSGAVLVFPLEENPPGSFDLVLGFLPPTSAGEAIGVVGNGHLELKNLFGGGRVLALRLNRLPGQTSSADVRLADPFILGLPVGLEAQFSGLQQDSAYTKQRYGLEIGMRLTLGMHGFVTLGREVTRPGVASSGDVARAEAWFAGVGVRMLRVDRRISPTRGYSFEAVAESGRKRRSASSVDPEPAVGEPSTVDQERLRLAMRLYVPVRRRQIAVLGAEAAAVLSGVGDQSDLIRFGGASSLRGYDEDRFLARTVGRGLIEYRYLLDRESFAFAFVDLGYVNSPELAGVQALRGFYPGYGIGMQFETAVGLVSASYAISSEAGPANGRIHVGLSFGL